MWCYMKKKIKKTSKARSKLRKIQSKKIKIRERKILKEVREQKGHSAYSLSIKLDIPLRTVQRSVKRLVDGDSIRISSDHIGKRSKKVLWHKGDFNHRINRIKK